MSADENKRLVALGGLLHRIGNFEPSSFESDFNSRLVLQKTIYLMEQFGLNIGYSFSWYLRGPYSPNLTRDTYSMVKSYSETPPVKFAAPLKERRFCEFLDFIRPISKNHEHLEKIAVIHFLCSMYPELSLKDVFSKVKCKIPSITYEEFLDLRRDLSVHDLLRKEQ